VLRRALLTVSRSDRVKGLVSTLPISSGMVARFVPGERVEDAVRASRELLGQGLLVSLDHLGEDTTDRAQPKRPATPTSPCSPRSPPPGLTRGTEVSVKLSAVGQALPGDGEKIALEHARAICTAARSAGTAVTIDMEDHTTTDSTLSIVRELRQDFPDTGAVLQAYLHRTEADCRELAYQGSRVRLCKGAYKEPESVAFQDKRDVDRSYVRCLRILMEGSGYPMVATHDPRLVDIASSLALRSRRAQGTYEFQMLYGIRPEEQRRLAQSGEKVRVYTAVRRGLVRLPGPSARCAPPCQRRVLPPLAGEG
jgi:proline dehydrogenase